MSITFNFKLENPFVDYTSKTLYWKDIVFAKNKSFEVQIEHSPKTLFEIAFHWTDKTVDHKGFGIELALLGYWIDLHVYDHRHAEELTDEEIAEWEEDMADYRKQVDERELAKMQKTLVAERARNAERN